MSNTKDRSLKPSTIPEQWVKAYEAGEAGLKEIAKALKRSASTISSLLFRQGVRVRKQGTQLKKKPKPVPYTVEAYQNAWGWTAGVYVEEKVKRQVVVVLRHLTGHHADRESAVAAARQWAAELQPYIGSRVNGSMEEQ